MGRLNEITWYTKDGKPYIPGIIYDYTKHSPYGEKTRLLSMEEYEFYHCHPLPIFSHIRLKPLLIE